jgi:hypothetical protein
MQEEIVEKCCLCCFLVGFINKKMLNKQFSEIGDLTNLNRSVTYVQS